MEADALHLVHGPIGCAVYTWDIRGALSSGPKLHRLSFSTDMQERDVIFGGEKKLYRALVELIDRHAPATAFVYSTCIVGIIGDDLEAVCRKVAGELWLIHDYFAKIGVEVVANITGDGRVADIQRAHGAALNVVQCSGATSVTVQQHPILSGTIGPCYLPNNNRRWPAYPKTGHC